MSIHMVLLDRDGVINENDRSIEGGPFYTTSWKDWTFRPGVLDAVAELTKGGIEVYVITMQNCILDGIVQPWEVDAIHREMCRAFKEHGGRIGNVFVCTSPVRTDAAKARAKSDAIHYIFEKFNVDPAWAVFVGDASHDMVAAYESGCNLAIQVRTDVMYESSERADVEVASLQAAVRYIKGVRK